MFINAVMYDGSTDRLSLSVPVMYGLFFAGEGCRECVRDWVVAAAGGAGHMVHVVTVPSGV